MVEIPDDVAKSLALTLRNLNGHPLLDGAVLTGWAALLDPQPPTLREQVLGVIRAAWYSDDSTPEGTADAVLAVVADWLAAQPLHAGALPSLDRCEYQRAHDVALIRDGGAS